ncbi:MAG: ABC transporter ATP-binding protein [Fusobacteriaceae bacterium]|jgi:iron(III) transport system ATP-binding protein|nr:ABC transporter ATP-binding protein [Fusobacteriaceae bacterium]
MESVRFENVTFRYGKHTIFENLSLKIDTSQIMGIVGPSGCGKTTLIRCLCGFIKPETGSIYIGDDCVYSAEKRIHVAPERRNIGVVFQDYAVWPHMTVWENVTYPMKKRRAPREEIETRARHALEQVRMTGYEKHLPSQLSGGQQQRVAIARALVSSRDVIVLDEPITNLDAKLREEMILEIRMIQKAVGTTIIYITHDQEAALQLCDKTAIMESDGVICQIGTDEEIIKSPANRFVFTFIGVANFVPLTALDDGVYIKPPVGNPVNLTTKKPVKPLEQEFVMGIRPMDIVFDDSSPIRAVVKSSTFLGSQYNYFLDLSGISLRVQANTLDVLQSREYQEGETVGIRFLQPLWFDGKKEVTLC